MATPDHNTPPAGGQPATQPAYTVQEAAAELGIGQRQLFRELRRRRILDRSNVPHPRWKERGYLRELEGTYRKPGIGTRFYSRPLVTASGLEWLRRELGEQVSA